MGILVSIGIAAALALLLFVTEGNDYSSRIDKYEHE